ncbi:hypothetical protein DIZ76_013597 [Coccidioides immitis]|nr:hypothetical protein DIZ76_013597 [Coccidioides immitis]
MKPNTEVPADMTRLRVQFIPSSYTEDQGFLSLGHREPSSRSHRAVVSSHDRQWHVKVTFKGELLSQLTLTRPFSLPQGSAGKPTNSKGEGLRRRLDLKSLISCIDFGRLTLLQDTVTEIELTIAANKDSQRLEVLPLSMRPELAATSYNEVAHLLRYSIREDSSRVIYPLYVRDSSPVREIWADDIQKKEDISGAVYRVQLSNAAAGQEYIFKAIDRPFYHPTDTAVIQQELRNLKDLFRVPNIVRLAGIVISTNPYQTQKSCKDGLVVLRGLLLEYHPGGTLEEALKIGIPPQTCIIWATQVAAALHQLHRRGITHMDLKPSNIVVDSQGNAVLIDVSGIGGTTYEWKSPEIRQEINPFSLPFRNRKWNDIWAFGQLVAKMATSSGTDSMNEIVRATTKDDPTSRIDLSTVTTMLKKYSQEQQLGGSILHY